MYKILLLEDNSIDIDLISREIKSYWTDVDLTVVSRVAEAKEILLNDYQYDLALFDLKLPDGNGMDLLSELRAQKYDLPIIILTAMGSEDMAIAALKSGANDYLPKKQGFYKEVPKHIEFTLKHIQENRQDISVLYVEHHKSDVDLTFRYLKKHAAHIQLTHVSTGEEVLDLLPNGDGPICMYDVLMLDYRLPGLNALEISKKIRQERNLSIAIIIVTGQGDESIAVEALKIGVDDYIVKHDNYLLRLPSVLTSAYRRREMERQQLALKQSETKYRLLADYAADWEYWINPAGEYIFISPACEKTSGYPPEAFEKNKNLLAEITLPEYRAMLEEHFTQKVKELHKPIEFQILTADGKEKWISHFCQPVYDDEKNYLGKRGVNRDVTEQKQAEFKLRQSEERFKRLFENLGDAVFVTQTGEGMGAILEVNSAAIQQTGYSREELLKMNIIHDISIAGTEEINSEDSDRQLMAGESVSYIEKKRRKNGEEYWTEIIITPIEYKGITAGLSINRDVTERIRAERIQEVILNISNATQDAGDLKETMKIIQKELGRLMDTENFFIALYDEEADHIHLPYYYDEKDDIVDFPAGKTLTGLVIKQGKSFLIDDAKAKKLEAEDKIEKIGFDSAIWLGVPLKIKGKVTGAFVIQSYTDANAYTEKDKEVLEIISHQISISIERKREEEKLLAALESAKESDRIKTAFLANMSHELRTPLNAVIGFSDLIDKDSSPDENAEFSKHINRSGVNLLGIVDEIFEVTLLEQGDVDINRSQKSVALFFNDVYQTILHRQKNLGASSVVIQQELKEIDQDTNAFTDFRILKQIFICILGNALKFTHEGFVRFGVYPSENENELVFFVQDTGIGIPEEKHEKIFERFRIGDESLTRKYSGVGVGLYISRKMTELLGGRIWLESELGKGSTFYFSIPR